jgi:hypothetical protein
MSVLSAQSIRCLCDIDHIRAGGRPMISPFVERGTANGRSYGLSACSYDVRIDKGLMLRPKHCALVGTMERFIFPGCKR